MQNRPVSSDHSPDYWGQIWGQLLQCERAKCQIIKWIRVEFNSTHHHQNPRKTLLINRLTRVFPSSNDLLGATLGATRFSITIVAPRTDLLGRKSSGTESCRLHEVPLCRRLNNVIRRFILVTKVSNANGAGRKMSFEFELSSHCLDKPT